MKPKKQTAAEAAFLAGSEIASKTIRDSVAVIMAQPNDILQLMVWAGLMGKLFGACSASIGQMAATVVFKNASEHEPPAQAEMN